MTSTIPDFPDVEKCFADHLSVLVLSPDRIGNFVIDDFDEQGFDGVNDDDALFITLAERGGPADMASFTAYPVLEVSCWGKSRVVARNGAKAVFRLMMLDPDGQIVAGGALFDSVEDVTGSQEADMVNPDDRCVTQTFQLECRPMFD